MDRADHTRTIRPSIDPSIRPPPCLPSVGIHVARAVSSAICPRANPPSFPEMCHCVSHVQLSLFLSLSRVELLSDTIHRASPAWEGGPALGGGLPTEGASHNPRRVALRFWEFLGKAQSLWASTAISLVARPCLLPLSARAAHVSSHSFLA